MNEQTPDITTQNSTLAVISLLSGIAGWTLVPFFGAIVAVLTGHMARREIREGGGRIGGEGLTTAGLVMGYGCLGVAVLVGCGMIAAVLFGLDVFGWVMNSW